jgi:hypothetical protein
MPVGSRARCTSSYFQHMYMKTRKPISKPSTNLPPSPFQTTATTTSANNQLEREQRTCPRYRQLLNFCPKPPEMQSAKGVSPCVNLHSWHSSPGGGALPARVTRMASRSYVLTWSCLADKRPMVRTGRNTGSFINERSRQDSGCPP